MGLQKTFQRLTNDLYRLVYGCRLLGLPNVLDTSRKKHEFNQTVAWQT